MTVRVRERDLLCAQCGTLIEHEVRNVEYLNSGLATAMLANDAVRDHREGTGCPATGGWREGEWGEEHDL